MRYFLSLLFAAAVAVATAVTAALPAVAQQTSQETSEAAKQEAIADLLRAYDAHDGNLQNLIDAGNTIKSQIIGIALQNLNPDELPTIGAGDTVIYEFSDYQCGYCRRMYPAISEAVANHNIRIALIEFPILGQWSTNAAQYALAAHEQGKFAAYHDALMTSGGGINLSALEHAAQVAQLDRQRLNDFLDSDKAEKTVEQNYQLALLLGISGTPAFIIDGQVYPGALRHEDFMNIVENITNQAN